MRILLALLLLSNLCLMGCKMPIASAQNETEEAFQAEEEDPADDPTFDPLDSERSPLSTSPESEGLLGPDAMAEPSEINGLKGSARSKGVWINYYHDSTHAGWAPQTEWLEGWANKRGLTVSHFGKPNFRYAVVRLIDIGDPAIRAKVTRHLIYEPYKVPMYPTLVLVDASGTEICHNIGSINEHHLDSEYDEHSRAPSKRKMGGGEVTKADPDDYRVEDPVTYECGPNGCRIVRRGK